MLRSCSVGGAATSGHSSCHSTEGVGPALSISPCIPHGKTGTPPLWQPATALLPACPSPASQFVPSKALPGGPQGVATLKAAVDLGKALQLTHMDLESLRDPSKLPQLSEALAARQAARRSRAGSTRRQPSRSLSSVRLSLLPACCDSGPAVEGGHEEHTAGGMADEGFEARRRGWRCCGGAAPQQQQAAARGSGSEASSAAAAAQEQQEQGGEKRMQLVECAAPVLVAAAETAAAADVAAAAGTPAAQRSQRPGRQRSFVHIKRFSTLLLRGSKSAAGTRQSDVAGALPTASSELAAGREESTAARQGAAPGAEAEDEAEPLPLHIALSYPDSIVLDASGSWVHLPQSGSAGGTGHGPSMQSMASRCGSLRLDLR